MASSSISFRAGMTRRLRRRGLRGNSVAVGFDGAMLSVAGDTFGRIDIALARLRRVRVGMSQAGGTIHRQILIWPVESGGPLQVGTGDASEHGRFATLVRALADTTTREGHGVRIETGESKRWAVVAMSLLGGQALAFAAITALVLGESEAALGLPRWIAVVFPLVFLLGALIAMVWAWSRYWPRRVRSLADLDRVLPPAA